MNQIPFQIFLSAILMVALAWTYAGKKQRRLGRFVWMLWTALWAAGLLATWFPEATTYLARKVGITRGVDLILYTTVTLMLLMLMSAYERFRRLERAITLLVRTEALIQPWSNTHPARTQDNSDKSA